MLKGGLEEPGGTTNALFEYNLGFNKHEFGGKTGTTSNCSDGWFVGVSPKLIAGAWVGGDDRAIHFRDSDNGEGSKTALPIVGRFLEKLYQDPMLYERWGGARFEKPKFKIEADYLCATSWSSYRRAGGDDSSVLAPNPEEPPIFEEESPTPPIIE
jgi:penicillin-binding protein 1A